MPSREAVHKASRAPVETVGQSVSEKSQVGRAECRTVWVQRHGIAAFFGAELIETSSLIGVECDVISGVIGHVLCFRGGEERVGGGFLAPDDGTD